MSTEHSETQDGSQNESDELDVSLVEERPASATPLPSEKTGRKSLERMGQEAEAVADKAKELDEIMSLDFGRDKKWTRDDKIFTVAAFMATGMLNKTSQITGVPEPTIKVWKNKTEWWPEAVNILHRLKSEEMDIRLTHIIDQSLSELYDRLKNGDETIVKGEKVRRKVSAKDVATILGIAHDKRALNRGDPTNRTESRDVEGIKELAKEFRQIAQQNSKSEKEIDQEGNVINDSDS